MRRGFSTSAALGFASVAVFLSAWELAGALSAEMRDLTSRPSLVAVSALEWTREGGAWASAGATFVQLFVGLVPAIVIGVLIGLVLGMSSTLRMLFDPILLTLDSLPRTLFMPVVIAVLGIGLEAKALMAFVAGVFPVLVNAVAGCRGVSSLLLMAARSFGASSRQLFTRVVLPATLPYIFAGVRLAVGRAITALVATEMYVSIAGLGKDIMVAQAGLNVDRLMFLIFLVAASGVLFVSLIGALERRWCGWMAEVR
jgi:ABC-type nitrate/sulfonate/bicarbonate transport system permease component